MTDDFDQLAPTDPGRAHPDWDVARGRIHDDVLARAARPRRRWVAGAAAAVAAIAVGLGAAQLWPGGQSAIPAAPSAPVETSAAPPSSQAPTTSLSPVSLVEWPSQTELVQGHPDLCEEPVRGYVPEGPDTLAAAANALVGFQFLWDGTEQDMFNVAVRGDTAAALETLRNSYHGPLCVASLEGPTRAEVEAVRDAVEAVDAEAQFSNVLTPDGTRVSLALPSQSYDDPAAPGAIREAVGEALWPWLVVREIEPGPPTGSPAPSTGGSLSEDGARVTNVLFNASLAIPGVYASSELLADGGLRILYLETHPRAQEFISQVNASAGEAAGAIEWAGTYYSQDLVMAVAKAAMDEAKSLGLQVGGGGFDEDSREFHLYSPDPPPDPFLSDQHMGDVTIRVRVVEGVAIPEAGEWQGEPSARLLPGEPESSP